MESRVMDPILSIGANISTPMMLAGFVAAAFFLVTRLVLQKNIFPALTRSLSANIIRLVIERFFWLAMVGMVLGFAGFVLGKVVPQTAEHKFAAPHPDMIKLSFESGWSIDLAPQPDKKNVVLHLKVVPKAAGHTPLSQKAILVLKGANRREDRRFPMSLNIDPEGVPPKIKSFLSVDGLLPKDEFLKLVEMQPPRVAQIEVEYDRDVNPSVIKFMTDEFEFSRRVIEEQTK